MGTHAVDAEVDNLEQIGGGFLDHLDEETREVC